MKKKCALILSFVLAIVLCFAACGGSTEEETKADGIVTVTPKATEEAEPTVTPEPTATPEPTPAPTPGFTQEPEE